MLDVKVLTKLASLNSSISLSEENLQSLLFPLNGGIYIFLFLQCLFIDTYYKVYMPLGKKTPGEATHNSGADNVQLALNPATKGNLSLECDESKAGSSDIIVLVTNKIKPSPGPYHVNDNTLQVTKLTALEGETIPETSNVISAGTGLKEQTHNSTAKQEGQTNNSNLMFCTDKSKVRLKSNLKMSYNCIFIFSLYFIYFFSQRES